MSEKAEKNVGTSDDYERDESNGSKSLSNSNSDSNDRRSMYQNQPKNLFSSRNLALKICNPYTNALDGSDNHNVYSKVKIGNDSKNTFGSRNFSSRVNLFSKPPAFTSKITLKPSTFPGSSTSSTSSCPSNSDKESVNKPRLNPGRLNNAFAQYANKEANSIENEIVKATDDIGDEDADKMLSSEPLPSEPLPSEPLPSEPLKNSDENELKSDKLSAFVPSTVSITTSSSSLPLTVSTNDALPSSCAVNETQVASTLPSSSSSSSTGFVFGQNIHERIEKDETVVVPSLANGVSTSDMLFSSVSKQQSSDNNENENNSALDSNKKSLSESAEEYEARVVKRKYDEVAIITGEEDESNILQINCKLFTFDNATSNWIEKGRGILRVNDKNNNEDEFTSRLIMRIFGSLRVILNTMVWSGMTVEKANKKSVRLTAVENGQIKIHLITASNPKDVDQLFDILTLRIKKKKQKREDPSSTENTN